MIPLEAKAFLKPKEAAEVSGFSLAHIKAAIKSGKLTASIPNLPENMSREQFLKRRGPKTYSISRQNLNRYMEVASL